MPEVKRSETAGLLEGSRVVQARGAEAGRKLCLFCIVNIKRNARLDLFSSQWEA